MGEVVAISRPSEADHIDENKNDGGTPPPPPDEVLVGDGDGDDYVKDGLKKFTELLTAEAQLGQGAEEGPGGGLQYGNTYEMRRARAPSMPAIGRAAMGEEGLVFESREKVGVMPVDRRKELGAAAIPDMRNLLYGGRVRPHRGRGTGMPAPRLP